MRVRVLQDPYYVSPFSNNAAVRVSADPATPPPPPSSIPSPGNLTVPQRGCDRPPPRSLPPRSRTHPTLSHTQTHLRAPTDPEKLIGLGTCVG